MLVIDQIAYGNRFISKSPVVKALVYLALLVSCLIGPIWWQLLVMTGVGIVTIYASKLSLKRYLKWYLVPLPFLLISVLTIILTVSSNPLIFEKSVYLGSMYVGWTTASAEMALKLTLRSLSCLVCTYFFVFTVPFQQIILVMNKAKFPSVLIEISMLMYRFIFIFLESMLSIYHSQQLRFGYTGLKNSYQSLGRLMQLIVIEMLENYKQMTIALEIKFYQGEFPIVE